MAGIRRQRYLHCHFCGQRSPYKFDGFIRQFRCNLCDAENHLDENGDITDPPESAITTSAAPVRYASEKCSISPGLTTEPFHPPPASSVIFCATCIENQHMCQSMLAQYLPDSESDPEEYSSRERNFYKFKRSVEARYPQVCDKCRPNVDAALSQAGYKAKSDHLRRMMDRSRIKRTTQRTWLEYVNIMGRSLWVLGLLLQLLWHLTLVSSIIGEPVGLLEDREETPEALLPLRKVSEALPGTDAFSYYSVAVTLASLWWNPQFVSTFRGFTRHINGLRNWYGFQAVILVSRLVFLKVSTLKSGGGSNGLTRLLTLHTGAALFMIYLYSAACRTVTTDHTPLFGKTTSTTLSPTRSLPPPKRRAPKPAAQNLSQVLDEILQSPSSRLPPSPVQSGFGNSLSPTPSPSLGPNPSNRFGSAPPTQSSGFGFGGMRINNGQATSSQVEPADGEEMEWTPTKSPHRAFNTTGIRTDGSQKFNASPADPERGVFWFKVPPRPIDPASKLRNPPTRSLIVAPITDLAQQHKPSFTSSAEEPHPSFTSNAEEPHGTSIFGHKPSGQTDGSGLNIAQPKFFAKPPATDPRNELSGLFGQSFSLSADEDTEEEDDITSQRRAALVRGTKKHGFSNPRRFAFVEVVILVGCLAAWVHTIWSPSSPPAESSDATKDIILFLRTHSMLLTFAIMGTSFVIAGRITVGSLVQILASGNHKTWSRSRPSSNHSASRRRTRRGTGKSTAVSVYVAATLGAAEMAVAAYCALQIWGTEGRTSCANEGVYLLGGMVVHRIFYAFAR